MLYSVLPRRFFFLLFANKILYYNLIAICIFDHIRVRQVYYVFLCKGAVRRKSLWKCHLFVVDFACLLFFFNSSPSPHRRRSAMHAATQFSKVVRGAGFFVAGILFFFLLLFIMLINEMVCDVPTQHISLPFGHFLFLIRLQFCLLFFSFFFWSTCDLYISAEFVV